MLLPQRTMCHVWHQARCNVEHRQLWCAYPCSGSSTSPASCNICNACPGSIASSTTCLPSFDSSFQPDPSRSSFCRSLMAAVDTPRSNPKSEAQQADLLSIARLPVRAACNAILHSAQYGSASRRSDRHSGCQNRSWLSQYARSSLTHFQIPQQVSVPSQAA